MFVNLPFIVNFINKTCLCMYEIQVFVVFKPVMVRKSSFCCQIFYFFLFNILTRAGACLDNLEPKHSTFWHGIRMLSYYVSLYIFFCFICLVYIHTDRQKNDSPKKSLRSYITLQRADEFQNFFQYSKACFFVNKCALFRLFLTVTKYYTG